MCPELSRALISEPTSNSFILYDQIQPPSYVWALHFNIIIIKILLSIFRRRPHGLVFHVGTGLVGVGILIYNISKYQNLNLLEASFLQIQAAN